MSSIYNLKSHKVWTGDTSILTGLLKLYYCTMPGLQKIQSKVYINYTDSKLTRSLQNVLEGNSKMCHMQFLQLLLRNQVHNPRPSAGLCVEEEHEQHVVNEKAGCPFMGRWQSQDTGETKGCKTKILNRLFVNKPNDPNEVGCSFGKSNNFNNGKNEGKERWHFCQPDIWNLFKGTHRMLEAISLGSAMLWESDAEKRYKKSRFLYRVLFATPSNYSTVKAIKEQVTSSQTAVKDATGAAQGAAINNSKEETLDSALEEFQTMCTEYEAKNESLLGLVAAEQGNFATAVEHLHSSCKMGNLPSCFNLGLCYETGSGVLQDVEMAKHYYQLAANGEHSMALYNLGLIHLNCQESSDGVCRNTAAADCICGCNRVEGLNLMEKSAKLGLVQAQTYLGIHHINENQDVAKAVPYFQAAADQNDCEAQYFLAICYEQGWGVEVNECRAAQLYSLAANAGHESALYNLAVFNEHGLGGLPEDQAAAIELYQKAAELGSEEAKLKLEELKSAQTSNHIWQEKLEMFKQLHHQHHEHPETSPHHHHPPSSLSPSASSPNLMENITRGLASLWGSQRDWVQEQEQLLGQADGDRAHKPGVSFYLSESGGNFDIDKDPMPSPQDDGPFSSIKSIHRSHTYPNFSLVACGI